MASGRVEFYTSALSNKNVYHQPYEAYTYAELVDSYGTEYEHYHSKQIQGKQLHIKCCGETRLTVLDSRGSIQFTYTSTTNSCNRRMLQAADYTNISLALSEVMEEIGVSESIVKKRRRKALLMETMQTMFHRMTGRNDSVYNFGSQSEGTTTIGLKSDTDMLICTNDFNIITDWSEWEHGSLNFLIIQDENTAPGYCMLQGLRSDAPLPITDSHSEHAFRDQQGRILLKKSCIMSVRSEGEEQHGPAFSRQGQHGYSDSDQVFALPCKSLLPEVQLWLSQQTPDRWPTEDMKRYIANSACNVVPVGCRGSVNEDLEWRISTSLHERCLMFSLNITQIQVYVLMKMLLPNINLNVPAESRISSFMCKTIVLHCIQITDHNAWQSHNLIQCLIFCLSVLNICVMNERCPHFIIGANNLMARKFTAEASNKFLENFRHLFTDFIANGLFSIQTDGTRNKLIRKLTQGILGVPSQNSIEHIHIRYSLLINLAFNEQDDRQLMYNDIVSKHPIIDEQVTIMLTSIKYLHQIYLHGNAIERSACTLLVPGLCTTVGTSLASSCIQNGHVISQRTLDFLLLGLNSDVASSRLKLASVFYCAGDIDGAEAILNDVENRYDFRLCETVCSCFIFPKRTLPFRKGGLNNATNEQYIQFRTALCVKFLQIEINCAPLELQHEMFRSTPNDLPHRGKVDCWMDWAVVDSLPYLYFLQYKTYQRLARYNEQHHALNNLMLAICVEPNLGHRETALNLLGQCLVQENRLDDALQCYFMSLNIRPRNNAANFHVCRLLYRAFTQH